ncbi:hypothetical protein GCM10020255_038780 [Rhodococcus baikonurensis]
MRAERFIRRVELRGPEYRYTDARTHRHRFLAGNPIAAEGVDDPPSDDDGIVERALQEHSEFVAAESSDKCTREPLRADAQ